VTGHAVVIEHASDGGFGAWAPDLPGVIALGDTEAEALDEMRKAIEFHLDGLREDGLPIPQPSTVSATVITLDAARRRNHPRPPHTARRPPPLSTPAAAPQHAGRLPLAHRQPPFSMPAASLSTLTASLSTPAAPLSTPTAFPSTSGKWSLPQRPLSMVNSATAITYPDWATHFSNRLHR
jgi:predicted RNase H-like HicB family nuclease